MSELDDFPTAQASAASKGLVVVIPRPNELFVDIDDEASLKVFRRNEKLLTRAFTFTTRFAPSPSGLPDRFHVTVTLQREVTETERVLYQALLGSDLTRETLSYLRIIQGIEHPTLFFEKPEAPGG